MHLHVKLLQTVPLAAKLGALEVVLTDYTPRLLQNLEADARINCCSKVEDGSVAVQVLDWAAEAGAGSDQLDLSRRWTDEDEALRDRYVHLPTNRLFTVVLAAEFLYEMEHAHWLAVVIQNHLSPGLVGNSHPQNRWHVRIKNQVPDLLIGCMRDLCSCSRQIGLRAWTLPH